MSDEQFKAYMEYVRREHAMGDTGLVQWLSEFIHERGLSADFAEWLTGECMEDWQE